MALWTWLEICAPYMSHVTPQAKAPKKARQTSLHMLHTHTLLVVVNLHIAALTVLIVMLPGPSASTCYAGDYMRDPMLTLASFCR